MITSVTFHNFKGLKRYSVALKNMNLLVGPNNSGKSTILDAFRILKGAYRYASRVTPTLVTLPDNSVTHGYIVPQSSIPISTANIHTDYSEEPTTLTYRFIGNKQLFITFKDDGQTIMHFKGQLTNPRTAAAFRAEFPVNLAIVPTLGPFEKEENFHPYDYVNRWFDSRRASRLFRNMWFHEDEEFEEYRKMVEQTWPGMSICCPERFDNQLNMFCLENRITREIYWAGYGFQIWLQLLTHIVKAKNSDLLVVDEPEIYLHPDLQRKIVSLLRELGPKILLATHSVEIINEAEPDEVLLVEKTQISARRLSSIAGLQSAVETMGSAQNIQLARLARGKKILFVEGKDHKLLSKMANVAGYGDLFTSGEITVVPIQGFSQWERIVHAQWAFTGVLGENINASALFDRDYRCNDEVTEFLSKMKDKVSYVHVLSKKEIENYLLTPSALESAINRQLKIRVSRGAIDEFPVYNIEEMLLKFSEEFRQHVYGQLISKQFNYFKSKGIDLATLASSQLKDFETLWEDLENRLAIVPGKDFLALLNESIQNLWGISITSSLIIACMKSQDIAEDMVNFFKNLEAFRRS